MPEPNHNVNYKGGLGPPEKRDMIKLSVFLVVSLTAFLTMTALSFAEQKKEGLIECPAYGQYWRSYKWGWYGAKRIVKTSGEANDIIVQFYVPQNGIRIRRIIEGPRFFHAEIINSKGVVVDIVIIDKSTGRIRSIY